MADNTKIAERKNGLMEFLSSLRLAIYLFIILAIASILGTVIEQKGTESQQEIIRNLGFNTAKLLKTFGLINEPKSMDEIFSIGQKTYDILNKAQLFDMYHSWWFLLVLILFSINLFLCTLQRLPNVFKYYTEPVIKPVSSSAGNKFKTFKVTSGKLEDKLNDIRSILGKPFGAPLEVKENGETYWLFQKGTIGRVGVYVTHLSIFLIFIGSMIGSVFGFKGYVSLVEGEQTSTYWDMGKNKEMPLGFDLKCEKAYVEYYANRTEGMPKGWYSDLSVISNGKVEARKTIRVNDPLQYNNIWFYQSNFGQGGVKRVMVRAIPRDGSPAKEVAVSFNGEASVDAGTTIKLTKFVPDFVIAGNEIGTKSDELNNPAAQLEVTEGTEKYATWIFMKYPDFHPSDKGKYSFKFANIEASNKTGLQVGRDPGVNWVWAGCVLLIVGLYIAFFVPHKRVWVKAVGTEIEISGTTTKNKPSFQNEVAGLVNEIERSLKC